MSNKPKSREAVSVAMRFHIMRRDKYTCQYCGAKAPDTALHIEHVIPVVSGGTNDPGNLVAACIRCNAGKGVGPAKSVDELRPETDRERELRLELGLADRVHSWAWWVGFTPVASVEVKAVLYALAHFSDAAAEFSIDFGTLSKFTALPAAEVMRICDGLEAVGLILPNEHVESTLIDVAECGPPSTLGALNVSFDFQKGGAFRPPYALSDYVRERCFSSVDRIYG